MYEQYYGLAERPFDLSPNPRFLFFSKSHREALMHLRYGLTGRPGITVLIGDAGTGKTNQFIQPRVKNFGLTTTMDSAITWAKLWLDQ